jgi:hypothetical protein
MSGISVRAIRTVQWYNRNRIIFTEHRVLGEEYDLKWERRMHTFLGAQEFSDFTIAFLGYQNRESWHKFLLFFFH